MVTWELIDGFESGDTSEWTNDDQTLIADTSRAFEGSYAGHVDGLGSYRANRIAFRDTPWDGEQQIKRFRFYYNETQSSNQGGIRLVDDSGNGICVQGTDNPQWAYSDGSSIKQLYDGGGNYGVWHKVEVDFDWSNGTYDLTWENLRNNTSRTATPSLNATTGVGRIELVNTTIGNTVSNPCGDNTPNTIQWWDNLEYVYFSPPSTPQNLSTSASGDDITLNWDSVSWNRDQGHYDIFRDGSYLTQVGSGNTSYTNSNLLDGERYSYRVRASNSAGTSSKSNSSASTTALPAPSNLTVN